MSDNKIPTTGSTPGVEELRNSGLHIFIPIAPLELTGEDREKLETYVLGAATMAAQHWVLMNGAADRNEAAWHRGARPNFHFNPEKDQVEPWNEEKFRNDKGKKES